MWSRQQRNKTMLFSIYDKQVNRLRFQCISNWSKPEKQAISIDACQLLEICSLRTLSKSSKTRCISNRFFFRLVNCAHLEASCNCVYLTHKKKNVFYHITVRTSCGMRYVLSWWSLNMTHSQHGSRPEQVFFSVFIACRVTSCDTLSSACTNIEYLLINPNAFPTMPNKSPSLDCTHIL